MTDKEKIIQYLNYKGISKNKFYTKTGLSIGFLDSGSSLGVDKLRLIIDNYHDFNLDWLITGKGSMIKTEHKDESLSGEIDILNQEIKTLQSEIIKLQKQIIKMHEEQHAIKRTHSKTDSKSELELAQVLQRLMNIGEKKKQQMSGK